MLRRTMRPVIIGAVIGVAAAAGVAQLLSSVLFGVSPADPLALSGQRSSSPVSRSRPARCRHGARRASIRSRHCTTSDTLRARLAAGVTRDQAAAELAAVFERFRADYPELLTRTETGARIADSADIQGLCIK